MRIYKFGGASVKDADSVRNVANIISNHKSENDQKIVVVSAMGKMTNLLELIVLDHFESREGLMDKLNSFFDFHTDIVGKLNFNSDKSILERLHAIRLDFENFLKKNESKNYNFIYDQIVSKGEMLSTTILYEFLLDQDSDVQFVEARNIIKTDSNFTDANIHWEKTRTVMTHIFSKINASIIITQGFLGADDDMNYTTLGREGSDYTAAIIANCTNTSELTIWKDVDGVFTADPKKFPEATIVPKLSYKEAVEMSFYGAQIIHPKTIKPIQNSSCVLKVKSFNNKDAPGTEIGNFENLTYAPAIVLKENQVLYSFYVKDFSFLNETNLGKIIATFGHYSLRINLMQNTAIEFMVVTDEKLGKNEQIREALSEDFDITIQNKLKLMTIRHFDQPSLSKYSQSPNVIVTQKGLDTIHLLISE
ncbi:MAG: aspartate kinase [Chitinophagales bacterium]